MSGHDITVLAIWTSMGSANLEITCSCGSFERTWEDGGNVPLPDLTAAAAEHAPGSPWLPAGPDRLPPATYPAWRSQEQARRQQATAAPESTARPAHAARHTPASATAAPAGTTTPAPATP